MLFTVKDDLKLLRDLKLTPKQLMFIKMLVQDHSTDEKTWRRQSYAMTLEFQDLCPLTAEELAHLLSHEIIIDLNQPGGKMYYDCFELNPKYLRRFTLAVIGMPSALYDAYPHKINYDGLSFNGKDCGPEEIAEDYMRAINKDEEQHKVVMEDLEWAILNNALPCGIKKFVKSRYWLYIRDLRKKMKPKHFGDGRIG